MPSPEELKKAVEEMKKQGLPDEEIRSTLSDLGADEGTISEILGPSEKKDVLSEIESEKTEEIPEVKPISIPEEEVSIPDEHVEKIHRKIDELHEKITAHPMTDDIAEVKEMLRELKKDIREVHAMFSAVQKLLQEVLDTNRSILVELSRK